MYAACWCVTPVCDTPPATVAPFCLIFPFPACSFHALSTCNDSLLQIIIIILCDSTNAKEDRGHDWNFHHLSDHPTLRRLNIRNHELTDAKIAFLPSLPELRSLHMNLPATLTTLESTLMRCPKLRKLNYDLYHFDPYA